MAGMTDERRDHQARVRVADDVWRDFRQAAGALPISYRLGEMVELEVERWRASRAQDAGYPSRELLDALGRIEEIAERVQRLRVALSVRLDATASGQGGGSAVARRSDPLVDVDW